MNKIFKELIKKNNSTEKLISEENMKVYTNMVVYLRGSDLTMYNQELVREDIIELIIDGQQRGDDIQNVMGGRYKEICDEIIDVMPKKTKKKKVMEFVSYTLNALWILGVIALVTNLVNSFLLDSAAFRFVLTVGDIIAIGEIILVAHVTVKYISKTAFNTKNRIKSFFESFMITTAILAVIIISSIYLNTIVISMPLWVATITVLLIFVF